MLKNTHFSGQPIFSQILSLIPRPIINKAVYKTDCNRYYKKFKAYDHLVAMLYACFERCTSLREVTTGLLACQHKLLHLGLRSIPKRSTLSDANRKRTEVFFSEVYQGLYKHYYKSSPDSRLGKSIEDRLFMIDSTTISLFSEVMKGMGSPGVNGRKKGGAKAHMLVKANEDVPSFVKITSATKNDKEIFDSIQLAKGSIVVFDKGYNSYKQFEKWNRESVTWVTRMSEVAWSENKEFRVVSAEEARTGVRSDSIVVLGRPSNSKTLKIIARKIVFYDQEKKREFTFITNNLKFKASTIAAIYKRRWQIELLFKRLKQNYPLRYFLGDNENAIKIQIWCALIADLMLKVIKTKSKKMWSYANLAGMIRLHLMNYLKLIDFLNNPEKSLINYKERPLNQLVLYET